MRDLVNAQMPTGRISEFEVIKRLGSDLPGAVVVGDGDEAGIDPSHADAPRNDVPKLKFSLAGVQLKFSSVKVGGRLTLPANGTTGNVIAKLPHAQYPDLPEIEFSSMMLAHAAGVDIASQVGLIKTNT